MLFTRKRVIFVLLAFSLIFTIFSSTAHLYAKEMIDEKTSYMVQNYLLNYTIKKGDTLWGISKRFDVRIEELQVLNQLNSSLIITGDILKIPQSVYVVIGKHTDLDDLQITKTIASKPSVKVASIPQEKVNQEDRYWLAKIIEAEAGGEPLKGKVAVGAVVLNRVDADWFPDTIKGVIFQKYKGSYQFSPVGNGRIKKIEPSDEAYKAADLAIKGEDPTDGALYFYNPKISKSKFFKSKEVLVTIGSHQFFQ